jgi:hypothetical protein
LGPESVRRILGNRSRTDADTIRLLLLDMERVHRPWVST